MAQANATLKDGRDDEGEGNELNTLAMPSQIEILRRAHESRKKEVHES